VKTLKSFFNPISALVGGVLFLAGCPFFGIGAYEAVEAQQETQTFIAVTGTVVDNSYQTTYNNGNEEGAYYPVVEFTVSTGEKVRFTDGVGSLPPDYEAGEQVPVLYNPEDMHEARLNTWKRVWFVPTLLICIGGLPILVFVGWLLVSTSIFSRGYNV
jgi:hypothetical protein